MNTRQKAKDLPCNHTGSVKKTQIHRLRTLLIKILCLPDFFIRDMKRRRKRTHSLKLRDRRHSFPLSLFSSPPPPAAPQAPWGGDLPCLSRGALSPRSWWHPGSEAPHAVAQVPVAGGGSTPVRPAPRSPLPLPLPVPDRGSGSAPFPGRGPAGRRGRAEPPPAPPWCCCRPSRCHHSTRVASVPATWRNAGASRAGGDVTPAAGDAGGRRQPLASGQRQRVAPERKSL